MVRRVDRWLIDKPFQTAVDLAQRQPAWMVRQCVLAGAVVAFVRHLTEPGHALWVTALGALCALMLFAFTFRAEWVAALGGLLPARVLSLMFLAMSTGQVVLSGERYIAVMLGDLLSMGLFYFAACRPPRPREPRRKLARAGGAA